MCEQSAGDSWQCRRRKNSCFFSSPSGVCRRWCALRRVIQRSHSTALLDLASLALFLSGVCLCAQDADGDAPLSCAIAAGFTAAATSDSLGCVRVCLRLLAAGPDLLPAAVCYAGGAQVSVCSDYSSPSAHRCYCRLISRPLCVSCWVAQALIASQADVNQVDRQGTYIGHRPRHPATLFTIQVVQG